MEEFLFSSKKKQHKCKKFMRIFIQHCAVTITNIKLCLVSSITHCCISAIFVNFSLHSEICSNATKAATKKATKIMK